MAIKVSDLIKCYEDSTSSGDFSIWCDKLELIAQLQKVTDLASFMPLFLAGPAFAVYKELSDEVKKDYKRVKAELLTAFGVNCFAAYEQLQSRVLLNGETVDVYLADLRRLVALTGQEFPEPILRCAFVAGLPTEISTQLKSIVAVERLQLQELVSRARMMLSSIQTSSLACASVRINSNNKDLICRKCSGRGHFARDCPTGSRVKRQLRCYRCQELGHIAKECSQQGNDAGGVSPAPDALPTTKA